MFSSWASLYLFPTNPIRKVTHQCTVFPAGWEYPGAGQRREAGEMKRFKNVPTLFLRNVPVLRTAEAGEGSPTAGRPGERAWTRYIRGFPPRNEGSRR